MESDVGSMIDLFMDFSLRKLADSALAGVLSTGQVGKCVMLKEGCLPGRFAADLPGLETR